MTIPPLTENQRRVFAAVYAEPRSSVSDLAQLAELSRPRVSRVVVELERLGLVVSERLILERAGGITSPITLRICEPAPWTVEA